MKLNSLDKIVLSVIAGVFTVGVFTLIGPDYSQKDKSKPKALTSYNCRDCDLWIKELNLEYEKARKSGTLTRYFPDFQKYHEKGHKNE